MLVFRSVLSKVEFQGAPKLTKNYLEKAMRKILRLGFSILMDVLFGV